MSDAETYPSANTRTSSHSGQELDEQTSISKTSWSLKGEALVMDAGDVTERSHSDGGGQMVDGASSSSVTLIAGAVYEALIREDCLKGGCGMKGEIGRDKWRETAAEAAPW